MNQKSIDKRELIRQAKQLAGNLSPLGIKCERFDLIVRDIGNSAKCSYAVTSGNVTHHIEFDEFVAYKEIYDMIESKWMFEGGKYV